MDAAVVIGDLHVRRGGNLVLPGIDLEVERGRVTGLLGPSGGGKSTLIRAIVGVQQVESGTVSVLGLPAGSAALRARVGYMTQELAVYKDLTVRENLRYFARLLGASSDNAERTLDQVELRAVADRPVERLSGGQQARVSLATALLGSPELLVLDEPTVGLDPLLRRDLWALFAELAARGRTLIVSSHVMDEARHCDHLVMLREGKLLASDTPQRLLERTGSAELEEAFIALIDAEARA